MTHAARQHAAALEEWLDVPMTRAALSDARRAFDALAEILAFRPELRDELSPVLLNVFLRTGYLRDYKALRQYARRVGRPSLLAEVAPVVRVELPDVWILETLKRGDVDAALEAWFEFEDHDRARLCADQITAACPGRVDVLVSARLSVVAYQISRSSRSRYRRACRILDKLRLELERAEEPGMWTLVLEDVMSQHGHRPAFLDEFEKSRR